ncbi:poly-beta-1,6-N-acetyl-D-glucosamine biosynthesis protein PgaD [Marilutibacter chinensis]|uniref:Poly-beta-1,6-N-acetyl-D-glucosamine biosynthesis protein PgaD n=1 Tax=Marilutibacter chinensis TaxID=2912247 RepID=A0ABS9HRT8_9GAMM|nr:poly-beta-1,6-N-acetyl-D-glucosamine biosynthesis protein PgaD [Lysobacter chinensis]MCF7220832.1 poly-beta-1,6-N-acetyl-D-glucosamine biosynthesis protein PgaD [Lysobacter chinensis]
MKHDSLLIERPTARPLAVRTAWGVVTAICWGLYAYLWLPLLTLILWLFGVHTAVTELYLRNNQVEPFMLIVLPLVALGVAALLTGWAELNRARFRNRERRSATPDATAAEVADTLGATPVVASALRSGKITVVSMDDKARPLAAAHRHPPSGKAEPAPRAAAAPLDQDAVRDCR